MGFLSVSSPMLSYCCFPVNVLGLFTHHVMALEWCFSLQCIETSGEAASIQEGVLRWFRAAGGSHSDTASQWPPR